MIIIVFVVIWKKKILEQKAEYLDSIKTEDETIIFIEKFLKKWDCFSSLGFPSYKWKLISQRCLKIYVTRDLFFLLSVTDWDIL